MGERDTDGGDGFVGRMEVVSGRTGRRIWPDDVKGRSSVRASGRAPGSMMWRAGTAWRLSS